MCMRIQVFPGLYRATSKTDFKLSQTMLQRILDAFFAIPIVRYKKLDAPPVDLFELVTNKLASNNFSALFTYAFNYNCLILIHLFL